MIKNIDEAYNFLIVNDYWEQPSIDICNNIINFLNYYIENNPNDAKAYYLRSMAKFNLSNFVPLEYASGNKPMKTLRIMLDKYADDTFEDFNKAISIDSDIVNKISNVRSIRTSSSTGLKYYFRQPVTQKY